MPTDAAIARKKWEWNRDKAYWQLRVGILEFCVQEYEGAWRVARLGLFVGQGHATKEEAFEEAEERAFLLGMEILLQLPIHEPTKG